MADPLVSVVTPSYNQAEFIEDTIRSVRRQSHPAIEHVVVDGESDDGTLDVLRAYDEDLDWISEPDEGQSDAINKGFDRATGDIIGWLNSDDVYFDTGVIERVVRYFEEYDADVIYGDVAVVNGDSNVLKLFVVPDFDYERLLRGCFIEQPALFFRDHVLAEHRLDANLDLVMDYEFWLRLAREFDFRHVSDVLAGDRNHSKRKILDRRVELQHEAKAIRRKYGATFGRKYRIVRTHDVLTSSIPRGFVMAERTYRLHRNPPELAFDGELLPLQVMLGNLLQANRNPDRSGPFSSVPIP
jgi:glycosyltransferase involved in cell wall biosynthesis